MALDHFVSQVHLRKFYAPALNCKKMYAWRKSKPEPFFCDSRDVCRIPDGSTNEYIAEPRAIEEFLRLVEPRYNQACAASIGGNMVFEDVFALAGLVAFIITCSPTAIRLGRQSIAAIVDTQARLLDQQGLVGRAPKELGRRSLSDLLDDESVSRAAEDSAAENAQPPRAAATKRDVAGADMMKQILQPASESWWVKWQTVLTAIGVVVAIVALFVTLK